MELARPSQCLLLHVRVFLMGITAKHLGLKIACSHVRAQIEATVYTTFCVRWFRRQARSILVEQYSRTRSLSRKINFT